MRKILNDFRFTPAVISLLVMNLIPLVGVIWFRWDAGIVVFLYWIENIIIGLLNIPKIIACKGGIVTPNQDLKGSQLTIATGPAHRKRKAVGSLIFLSVFFSIHYGLFCLGHYVFLKQTYRSLPGVENLVSTLISPMLFFSILGLFLSHVISMGVNFFGKKEYLERSPNAQMFLPYSRIVLLHVVIVFSGFLAIAMGQGLATLIMLVQNLEV